VDRDGNGIEWNRDIYGNSRWNGNGGVRSGSRGLSYTDNIINFEDKSHTLSSKVDSGGGNK